MQLGSECGRIQRTACKGCPSSKYRCARLFRQMSTLLSKKRSKKELTKRPPFLVKSLACKTSEKTVNGGWRDGRILEPFQPTTFAGQPAPIPEEGQRRPRGKSGQRLHLLEPVCRDDVLPASAIKVAARNHRRAGLLRRQAQSSGAPRGSETFDLVLRQRQAPLATLRASVL